MGRALVRSAARRAFGGGEEPSPAPDTARPRTAPATPPAGRVIERPTPPPPAPPEPAHVSEEPELVAGFADRGAEDGAGAELRVAEPWEGYTAQNAEIICERLPAVSDEALAAVELFEATHRRRRTVVEAAARELRQRTAGRRV